MAAVAAALLAGVFALGAGRHATTHAARDERLQRPAHHHRHAARGRARRLRQRRRAHALDRPARRGRRALRDRAHAHNVVTLPSHANLLSGRYPLAHGVRDNSGFRFPAGTPTLATLLKEHGYRTGAFVSAFPLDSRFGLDARLRRVRRPPRGRRDADGLPHGGAARAPRTVEAGRALAEASRGEAQTFCFVHLYEPHFPYVPPPPFAARFAARPYDGEVAAADAALEPLLRPLLEAAKRGRTLVVLTSDHGEGAGRPRRADARHLRLRGDAARAARVLRAGTCWPAVVREPARHVDVLPTVLDFLGLEPPAGPAGQEPAARRHGERERRHRPRTSRRCPRRSTAAGRRSRGVVQERWKYVDLPVPELYDLAADPGETAEPAREPAGTRSSGCAPCSPRMRAGGRGGRARAGVGGGDAERLRALGLPRGRRRAAEGALHRSRRSQAADRRSTTSRARCSAATGPATWRARSALGRRIVTQRPERPAHRTSSSPTSSARGATCPRPSPPARQAVALRPDRRRERGAPRAST